MASSISNQPPPRQSRRQQGLAPIIDEQQTEEQQEEVEQQTEEQQEEVEQQNEQNNNHNTEDNAGQVSADLIPANVPDGWFGIDLSKNYVIDGNGDIIIDRRTSLDSRHNAKWRNDEYQKRKRKVQHHVGHMMSNTRAISIFFGTNSERLGQPRNVATQIYSPILYEARFSDLRLMVSNVFGALIEEMEERLRLDAEVSIVDEDFKIFIFNFRSKIEEV
eukprot:37571_1